MLTGQNMAYSVTLVLDEAIRTSCVLCAAFLCDGYPVLSNQLMMLDCIAGSHILLSVQPADACLTADASLAADTCLAVPQGETYRLVSSLLMHDRVAAVAVTIWGLATIAPEVEAVMG